MLNHISTWLPRFVAAWSLGAAIPQTSPPPWSLDDFRILQQTHGREMVPVNCTITRGDGVTAATGRAITCGVWTHDRELLDQCTTVTGTCELWIPDGLNVVFGGSVDGGRLQP